MHIFALKLFKSLFSLPLKEKKKDGPSLIVIPSIWRLQLVICENKYEIMSLTEWCVPDDKQSCRCPRRRSLSSDNRR